MVTIEPGGVAQRSYLAAAAIVISALGAVAVAVWLAPASVQIVGWSPEGPQRIAYFAPLRSAYWIGSGTAIAIVFATLVMRSGVRPLAHVLAPLQGLWVWAVPFLPLVPDRLPLLLIFAGPVRLVIAFGVVVAVVARALDDGRAFKVRLRPPGRRTVFAMTLAIYLAAGLAWNRSAGLFGDEPHYLVIAHSLLVDHDLDIENNHAQRDYAAFYPGVLKPDYLARGRHGEIYSVHAPGLPALLVPAYGLAGARGAIVFVALIGAMTAVAIFDAAVVLGGPGVAWLTWLSLSLTVPVIPHAWLIYPEIVAALIVAWAFRRLVQSSPYSAVRVALLGVGLAFLPWLHTKYIVLLLTLGLAVALDIWRRQPTPARRVTLAALIAPIVLSSGAWLVSFDVMYGRFDPQTPYAAFAASYVTNANIVRGLLGFAFDQKFGLFVYAPVYAVGLASVGLALRQPERRLAHVAALGALVLFAVSSARFYMWWGGASAPGRFLVPIVPLMTPFVVVAALRWRWIFGAALAVSLAMSGWAMAAPDDRWLFSDPHGTSRIMTAMQGPAPLTSAWPTFTEPEWRGQFTRAARALAGRFETDARFETIAHGREALLAGWNGDRLRIFDYASSRKVEEAFVLANGRLEQRLVVGESTGDLNRLAGPFALAAGAYDVRVWFAGEPAVITARYHRGPAIATFSPQAAGLPVEGKLSLPVDAPLIWFGVTAPAAANRIERVEVNPLALVRRDDRVPVNPIAIEPLDRGGMLIYADRNSYPEGGVFWTVGTRDATVLVSRGNANRMTATFSLGPQHGTVLIAIGHTRHSVEVGAGATSTIPLPLETPIVPIVVESNSSFVPARADPSSDDVRRLGCQVRIQLQ